MHKSNSFLHPPNREWKSEAPPSTQLGPEFIFVRGFVNFVPAVAHHFCLNLPEVFSQPGAHFLAQPCTCAFSHLNCFRVRTSLRKSPSSTSPPPPPSPPLIRRSISNLKLGFARRRWRHRQFSEDRLGEHTYTWLGFITSHQLREIGWKICVLFTYCKQVKALFSSNFIQMMGSNKP